MNKILEGFLGFTVACLIIFFIKGVPLGFSVQGVHLEDRGFSFQQVCGMNSAVALQ